MANLFQSSRVVRTYKSYAAAVAAIDRICARNGISLMNLRFVIATNDRGAFTPMVLLNQPDLSRGDVVQIFAHSSVTVIG